MNAEALGGPHHDVGVALEVERRGHRESDAHLIEVDDAAQHEERIGAQQVEVRHAVVLGILGEAADGSVARAQRDLRGEAAHHGVRDSPMESSSIGRHATEPESETSRLPSRLITE